MVLEGRVCEERKIREGRKRMKERRYFIPVLIRRHQIAEIQLCSLRCLVTKNLAWRKVMR